MTSGRPPRLAITLGDVAGIGPEIVVRALADEAVRSCCRPFIVGDGAVIARASESTGIASPLDGDADAVAEHVAVATPGLDNVQIGAVDARAGEAAYQSLMTAIKMALAGEVDGIVTAPLSKYALHQAGHDYPGHTEILAEACCVREYAMMLYIPPGEIVRNPHGLAVAHTTLHTSIASVPGLLSTDRIAETITLTDDFLRRVGCDKPRVGVCALNPHAGEAGLFGDEEAKMIQPAVQRATGSGIEAQGPYPADTLFKRAVDGEFDGVVAMYHDQGHIALKLIAFGRAVNVTLGLPIVRTSPSHGTAFDIAPKFQADPAGMIAAIKLAAQLASSR